MAKPSRSAGRQQGGRSEGTAASGGPPGPAAAGTPHPALAGARAALAKGDVRTARRLASDVARNGPDAERDAAQRLLAGLAPDPAALLVAGLVLLAILIAAWLALFRVH